MPSARLSHGRIFICVHHGPLGFIVVSPFTCVKKHLIIFCFRPGVCMYVCICVHHDPDNDNHNNGVSANAVWDAGKIDCETKTRRSTKHENGCAMVRPQPDGLMGEWMGGLLDGCPAIISALPRAAQEKGGRQAQREGAMHV